MGIFESIMLGLVVILIIVEVVNMLGRKNQKTKLIELETAHAKNLKLEQVNLTTKFELWKKQYEKSIRTESVTKSKDVTRGHIVQNLLPLLNVDLSALSTEPIDFNDFQAMGSPIDYIYFKGLSAGKLTDIIFIEVKSQREIPGKKPSISLPKRERQIRDVVNKGKVSWELLHLVLKESSTSPEIITIPQETKALKQITTAPPRKQVNKVQENKTVIDIEHTEIDSSTSTNTKSTSVKSKLKK